MYASSRFNLSNLDKDKEGKEEIDRKRKRDGEGNEEWEGKKGEERRVRRWLPYSRLERRSLQIKRKIEMSGAYYSFLQKSMLQNALIFSYSMFDICL